MAIAVWFKEKHVDKSLVEDYDSFGGLSDLVGSRTFDMNNCDLRM